jgi:glycosyltransferase involved in cell wall biosynthesis
MKISVLIPAKDESDRIEATVKAARALPHVKEVIVIDDGSLDDTGHLAQAAGARVVYLTHNQGKATALMAGGAVAKGDVFLLLDADLGATAREAAILIPPIRARETDMTIATFPVIPGRGGGHGVVVRTARAGIEKLTGRTMLAPLSGQRCMTRAVWDAVQPLAAGFGVETAMTITALKNHYRLTEIETQMDHRVTQNDFSAQLHRLRQLRDVVLALLKCGILRKGKQG